MIEFTVTPKKKTELLQRMESLGISESDLSETFVKSSGKGGQKVNKTSTAVVLVCRKEEIEIKCSRSRSQGLNRYYARVILCEKLEMKYKLGKKFAEVEKIRKNKKRKQSSAAKKKVE